MSQADDYPTEFVPILHAGPGDRLALACDREDDWIEMIPEYGESIYVPARDLLAAVTRLVPREGDGP